MLQFIRGMIHSKWGVGLTLVLFGIIALAFGLGSVTGSGPLGGSLGGDRVATIGSAQIGTADLAKEVNQEFDTARQQDPKLSMKTFIANGGFAQATEHTFDRAAITLFSAENGIIAGKRLVDSELAKSPALQGPDGKFSQTQYNTLLMQKGLTDAEVRNQIGVGLIARQALLPAQFGAEAPGEVVRRYTALLKEQRIGTVAVLPAQAFAPKTPPSDAVLAAFYQQNRDSFTRPERRVLRYAIFDASVVKQAPAPSDAQIAAYYTTNAAQYAASESRAVTTLILPDEASARAAIASGGLEAAAKAKGLTTAKLGPLTREALAAQTTPEAAAAVFAASRGAVAGPVKSALGWYVLRVDAVNAKPARSLAQAHDEIGALLGAKMRQTALAELTQKIDDGFEKGGALADAAKVLGIPLSQTGPLTADGQVYGQAGTPTALQAPKQLARIIPTAFAMERSGAPQLAELNAGKSYVIFDVAQIAPAAPAPLAEIKRDVASAWALKIGSDTARIAAQKVLAGVKKGMDLGQAISGLGLALPPVKPIAMSRDQIAKMQASTQGHVPPVLSLFFGMAPGTTKLIPAPGNRGWLMVQLKQAQPGAVAAHDPLLFETAKELRRLVGDEYADELRLAIRNNMRVKPNDAAISRVQSQLSGGT